MENFVGRNQGDGVNRLWSVRVVVRPWSVEFFDVNPLDTFVAGEPEGYSSGTLNKSWNVDPHVSIDSLSRKVEILVSLDIKLSHFAIR